ncbi:hypothetical protein B0H14DRAFT_2784791 [Mycena olivaceomarginata]|nr:hypothetical protein B0H14DRAFT_2784791 [Mycena olivaceomarginata]
MIGLPSLNKFERKLAEDPETHRVSDYVYNFIQETVAESRNIYFDKIELEKLKMEISQLNNYASLPDKILLAIFRSTLPPSWLLDGVRSMLPYPQDISSVDLRMKLSILAVCKSWNHTGTELLYKRVILRRITQLPVFTHMLEGREGLGALVKHVGIDCFVPHSYLKLHEHETKQILGLCPNLSHVGLSLPFWIPELVCPPLPTSSSIISLEYSPCIPFSTILPSLVLLSQTLESLTFTVPAAYEGHSLLNCPKLEYLRLTITSTLVASEWLALNLQRLWLSDYNSPDFGVTEKLLRTYGPTITSLQIRVIICQQWLDLCPLLEHLSVADSLSFLTHLRVRFVDIFIFIHQDPSFSTLELLWDRFPALLECRILDLTMNIAPDICQKTYGSTGGRVADVLEFTDPTSVNGGAFIQNNISDDYVPNSDDSDGRSDGSEYVLDSDEDDKGSNASDSDDAASCITVSEDGGYLEDKFYMQEYWEVGRNEALAIFDQTRDS